MAKLAWAVLCERILVDKDTNRVSYIDLMEGLEAHTLPAGLPQIYVATVWARESESEAIQVRFRLLPPGSTKSVVEFITGEIELKTRQRINLNLQGAQAHSVGEYTVAVDLWDGERYRNAARLPLVVTKKD